MARKTIEVETLKEQINQLLDNSETADNLDDSLNGANIHPGRAARAALAAVLEGILIDTGNYKGFRYMDPEGVNARKPGVDETRRRYL